MSLLRGERSGVALRPGLDDERGAIVSFDLTERAGTRLAAAALLGCEPVFIGRCFIGRSSLRRDEPCRAFGQSTPCPAAIPDLRCARPRARAVPADDVAVTVRSSHQGRRDERRTDVLHALRNLLTLLAVRGV